MNARKDCSSLPQRMLFGMVAGELPPTRQSYFRYCRVGHQPSGTRNDKQNGSLSVLTCCNSQADSDLQFRPRLRRQSPFECRQQSTELAPACATWVAGAEGSRRLQISAWKQDERAAYCSQGSRVTYPAKQLMNTRSKAMVGRRPSSRVIGPPPTEFFGITNGTCLTQRFPI